MRGGQQKSDFSLRGGHQKVILGDMGEEGVKNLKKEVT